MEIDADRYMRKEPTVLKRIVGNEERNELIVWFRDTLNVANARDGKCLVTAGRVGKCLQGIPTHDLGRDIYFIRREMEEALRTGFPVGVAFYRTIKILNEARRAAVQASVA